MKISDNKTTVQQYFGISQQYHSPVLYKQSRFYLIKIQKITNVSPLLKKNIKQQQSESTKNMEKAYKTQSDPANKFKPNSTSSNFRQQTIKPLNYQITFQVGCRSSSQTIELDFYQQEKNITKKQRVSQIRNKDFQKKDHKILQMQEESSNFLDLHIFPFERQEVMSVTFKNSENSEDYGYALMPLVPFIKMPQTKHQIQVQLVFFNDKKQIRKEVAAVLQLSLYFLDGFKGKLIVQPVEACLGRNLAEIGQMSPIIRMFLRDNEFSTERIQQGGVRPNWQSSNKFCYFNIPIRSGFDELFIYLFYNREVTNDEIIGYYKIDLQNQGIFKQGECMLEFKKQEQMKRKRQKLDERWLGSEKQESKLSLSSKKKKGMSNDLANVNKTEKIYILGEQKRKQMEQYQLKWVNSQLQNQRGDLINNILQNVTTISSQFPPEIVQEKTQNIYQLYEQKEKQIFQEFQKTCKVNIHQFVGQDLEQLSRRGMTSLKGQRVKQEIRKMVIKQLKMLLRFAQQKMEEIKVPLLYTPVTQQGQDSKTVEVGRLTLKYFFLYEFQIPTSQEEQNQQN